jgi:hypothetical protein
MRGTNPLASGAGSFRLHPIRLTLVGHRQRVVKVVDARVGTRITPTCPAQSSPHVGSRGRIRSPGVRGDRPRPRGPRLRESGASKERATPCADPPPAGSARSARAVEQAPSVTSRGHRTPPHAQQQSSHAPPGHPTACSTGWPRALPPPESKMSKQRRCTMITSHSVAARMRPYRRRRRRRCSPARPTCRRGSRWGGCCARCRCRVARAPARARSLIGPIGTAGLGVGHGFGHSVIGAS